MNENPSIEIELLENFHPVKALVNFTVNTDFGEITISRIKVIQNPKQELWVLFPNICYRDNKSNESITLEIFIDCRKFKNAVSKMILDEYSKLVE